MAKRTLLQKYEIPTSHLDFGYVDKCRNGKEMEKIVKILRSGEEGYYPDLTKCAEDKLKELLPNSCLFRIEEQIKTKSNLCDSEWTKETEPFVQWSDEVKLKDNFLNTISNDKADCNLIPPIRHNMKKIGINGNNENNKSSKGQELNSKEKNISYSTDYKKWDKFDADTEILKIDLLQERAKEQDEIEKINQKNLEKSRKNIIEEISNENNQKEILNKLTNVEKEKLSATYKDRGNEYFKSKEFDVAINEYTKSVNILPSAAGYNNRAVAYLKTFNYIKCIEDCDKCLEIEPKNIKSLLRKGQALSELDKRRDAYEIFSRILSIDPSNITALNALNDFKKQLPDLPPATATRITIQDENIKITNVTKNLTASIEIIPKSLEIIPKSPLIVSPVSKIPISTVNKKDVKDENVVKKSSCYNYVQEDLSKLVIPKKIVKSQMSKTFEAISSSNFKEDNLQKLMSSGSGSLPKGTSNDITLLSNRNVEKKNGKNGILIEEIN